MDFSQENHVLVIFPHPDDEAFGVSGTMMKYRESGVPVTYACLTFGDMGRNLGFPPFATRESLHTVRKAEVEESARIMGVDDLRLLGFRDKTLEFEEHGKLKGVITDLINELSPTRIITFYPGYSVHPDHEATADAVIESLTDMPEDKRPALQLVAFDNRTFDDLGDPDIVIDIDGFTERKLDVMAAHRSQTGQLLEDLAADTQQGDDARNRWMRYENFYSYEID